VIHQVPSDLIAAVREIRRHAKNFRRFDSVSGQDDDGASHRPRFFGPPIDILNLINMAVGSSLEFVTTAAVLKWISGFLHQPTKMSGCVVLRLDRTQWDAVRFPFAGGPAIEECRVAKPEE